jgi:S-DNA-T family DNA segregation ATPase FtsK/SpoIIIE
MLLSNEIKEICKSDLNDKKIIQKQHSAINKFKRNWIKIMSYIGFYNKRYETYSLNRIEFTDYGLKSDIFIVAPLNFDKIDNARDVLEENLGCKIIFNHAKASQWINAKFIYYSHENKEFKPIKLKNPYDLYIGNDASGMPIIVSLKDYPHLMITGGTRSGKSKMTDCILSTSITNFSPKELQIFLIQVSKSDTILYEDAQNTRAFADTLEKTKTVLEYITSVLLPERDSLIRPYRKKALADNYHDYNKLKKIFDPIPTTLVVFDEMSSLYQSENNDSYKNLKQEITKMIDSIAQFGASLGVFLISSLQRSVSTMVSPFLKSQSTCSISFRQNNSKSSEVSLDDPYAALGLNMREFAFRLASKNIDFGLVPWINNKKVYEYIKPYLKPNHRTLFDDLEKLSHRNGVKKNKETLIEVGTHIMTEKEILEKNKAKNPNWVEYENPTGKTIIDRTKISLKTEKPIKKGREKIC